MVLHTRQQPAKHVGSVVCTCHASCADGPLLELPSGEGAWAKLNAGELAPVRVQYPARLWKALAVAAQHPEQLPEVLPAALCLLIESKRPPACSTPDVLPAAVSAAELLRLLLKVDVAGLIDDAWAIAAAGRGRITSFLDLIRCSQYPYNARLPVFIVTASSGCMVPSTAGSLVSRGLRRGTQGACEEGRR